MATIKNADTEVSRAVLKEREKFKKMIYQAIHDMNTPLTSLSLVVSSISEGDPESCGMCADIVKHAAVRMGIITDNLVEQVKQAMDD